MSGAPLGLFDGVVALPPGALLLEETRSLVVADLHLGYEEAIGGALPLWSMREQIAILERLVLEHEARELVLLGDVLHGSRMTDAARRDIRRGLERVAAAGCAMIAVAGNHEGRTRGVEVLGETFESVARAGWHLLHGDRPLSRAGRAIIGHLHPSLRLAGMRSAPVFLYCERLIVLPALTPYSPGLSVLSDECLRALRAWVAQPGQLRVAAVGTDRLLAFDDLARLRAALGRPATGDGPRAARARRYGSPRRDD